MRFFSNLQDKITYQVHKLTYDPEAEEWTSRREAEEAEAAARDAERRQREAEAAAIRKEAADKAAAQAAQEKEAADRASRSKFSTGRFVSKVISTTISILYYFLLIAGALYGAHLATNLNLYRSWPYRVLYAVYGAIFFPIVIVYVLGYRWFWKGKKPRYYGILPLIPYFINQPFLAKLLSWMSYKPDDVTDAFQEWNAEMVKKGEKAQIDAALEDNRIAALEAKKAAEAAEY